MPFTLSHPAAVALVWPLARRAGVPLSALAIGAMAPDFEFFLHLRPLARWSHSLIGLLTFCLPAGLLVFLAWEWIVREPIRDLLGFRPRVRQDPQPTYWLPRVALGIVLGAATHLLWDGFTHGGYWGVSLLPALRNPATSIGGYTVPWFNLLQHTSTIVGGVIVLGWIAHEARRDGAFAVFAQSAWRWVVILAVAGVSVAAGLWNGARWSAGAGYWSAQAWLGRVAVAALLGCGLALLAYSVASRVARSARATPAT